jgi:hypothetical protein
MNCSAACRGGLTRIGIDQLFGVLVHARRERKARSVEAAICAPVQTSLQRAGGFPEFRIRPCAVFSRAASPGGIRAGGFRVTERRARTFLCGPYIDVLLRLPPFRQALYGMNNRVADLLPFSWSADWMFLLEPTEKSTG